MSSLPTPPRLGLRLPLPPAPREGSAAPGDELSPGDMLEGRYQIEDRLGEGGVGFVYRARQIKLHRRVAIKLLQQDMMGDEELRPRFEREALTLAALSHPNIVSLNDYGAVRGRPYLVMELLEGRTLREVVDQDGALEPARALALARQVLLALAYAHQFGIVHRDLKPANLLVQVLPCLEFVKVLDFGLVKLIPGSHLDRGVQLSRVGFTFGTPAYMSPEHAVGGEVDGRSDLYAVGVLLFEMFTGAKPFDGELQDILRAHFQAPVPKMWERRPDLTGREDLQAFVEKAMAKERDMRFASAPEMIAALDALLAPVAMGVSARAPARERLSQAQEGAARVSAVVLEKARVTLVGLRARGGPLLARVGHLLRVGALRSLQLTRDSSKQAYVWLRPRALQLSKQVASKASDVRARLSERNQRADSEPPALRPEHTQPTGQPQEAELAAGAETVIGVEVKRAHKSEAPPAPVRTDPDATIVDEGLVPAHDEHKPHPA